MTRWSISLEMYENFTNTYIYINRINRAIYTCVNWKCFFRSTKGCIYGWYLTLYIRFTCLRKLSNKLAYYLINFSIGVCLTNTTHHVYTPYIRCYNYMWGLLSIRTNCFVFDAVFQPTPIKYRVIGKHWLINEVLLEPISRLTLTFSSSRYSVFSGKMYTFVFN